MRQLSQTVRPAAPVAPRPAARPVRAAAPALPSFVPRPVAPVVAEAGRPLPAPVRGEMESALGHDLGRVRVHDGAASAGAADAIDARAFTVGQHVGFGSGGFRPDTPEGRGLLTHELVHVLQGGTSDGARAEAEAHDAVARIARGERPTITRHSGPTRLHRAPSSDPAPPGIPPPTPASAPGAGAAPAEPAVSEVETPAAKLPTGMTALVDEPASLGTKELVVSLDRFALPLEKGAGDWVPKAYQDAAAGGRLVFSPLFQGNAVAAYKEGKEDYKSIWLGKFGFTSTKALTDAFAGSTDGEVQKSVKNPDVAATLAGLQTGLKQAKCDVDHIVEKQMGGTSIPSNLQLLTSDKNQASGRETYQALVAKVNEIRAEDMRGPKVRKLQVRIAEASVPSGTSDASFIIEGHLRAGRVTGSDAVKSKTVGKPVSLRAGGQGETVALKDTGETPIDSMARRIIPAMRLKSYRRGPKGAASPQDTVFAELETKAVKTTGSKSSDVELAAKPPAGGGAAAAAPQLAAGGAAPDPSATPAAEQRELTLAKPNQKVAFYYPYLSPGEFTSIGLDDKGNLKAEGFIKPTIPIFDKLVVRYSDEVLTLVAPVKKEQLKSPFPSAFRFTEGELALQLSPELVPSGKLGFSVGPAQAPLLLGDLNVKMTGGVMIATGNLNPARPIPGLTAASGTVSWRSDTGWSGNIHASSSSIPRTTGEVDIGFAMVNGRFTPSAKGTLVSTIGDKGQLTLGAAWHGQAVSYSVGGVLTKPLPMVERVELDGRYGEQGLWVKGTAPIRWNKINSTIEVVYARKPDQQEGRFSGKATFQIKDEKSEGNVTMAYDEDGRFTGKGTLAYQVTPHLRPQLGLEYGRDGRVKLSGEVKVNDLALTGKWPSPEGGHLSIIKGVGVKFNIPTPVPAVTAYGEIRGSLGLGYGVGPVMLKGVVFTGELYPLEDDPKIKAKLKGALVVPAYAELYGTFGAYVGLEVAFGAVGAKGGVEITPSLRITGEGGLAVDADYDAGGFSFAAEAYASGMLTANAKVDLVADLYAAYGLFSHRWTYNAASVSAQIGPTVKLIIGRIAYSKTGEMTWPSLSQVRMEPESIDPIGVVKDMLGRGKAVEK